MNNNKSESQELLRLFKCVVDTGTEVLSAFAGTKLLPTYGGCFIRFLDNTKHQIFHLWHSKKLLCCACPPAGCTLKRTGHMDNWIFKKLYDDNGNEDKGHIVRKGSRVEQVCLHKYITRNIAIHELDISAISFLLRNLAPLSQNETTALDTVTAYRSKICHAYSMNCYSNTELNTVWNDLENALVDLADPFYKRLIRKQLKDLQKVYLEKEEITELLNKVAEVNVGVIEVKNCMSSNNNGIEKCEENLKTMVIEESIEIKQAQQVVLQEVISSKAIVKESGDNMLEQFDKLNINQASIRGTLKDLMEMVHQIHSTTISVKYEQPADLSEGEECLVLWQLATPANWNPIEIEQILTKFQERFKDLPMKIKFVRNGSLVIVTTIPAKDLKESTTFMTAVKAFLTRMIAVCNIDTTVKCNVDVTLHILKSDEMTVAYSLPTISTNDKAVQTEDTTYTFPTSKTTLEKHRKRLEEIDVYFWNVEDEKEMNWVENTSRIFESKLDIKCAILAEELLCGVLTKRKNRLHLNRFQTIILTIAMKNYEEYEFNIEDDMPVVTVELDYKKEVHVNLRKYPYINCTVCVHLWFPRLNEIFKTKLRGHVSKDGESNKDEIDLDCVECKHAVTTIVHHRVKLYKGSNRKRFELCASLVDEGWILHLLYQMMHFAEPYTITRWDKSIGTSFRMSTDPVFVIVSPNSGHCKALEEYAYSVRRIKRVAIHTLQIGNVEGPTFTRLVQSYIDTTSMSQEELAQGIFLKAQSKHGAGSDISDVAIDKTRFMKESTKIRGITREDKLEEDND